MTFPVKTGGSVPAAHGGLVDGRSTGATATASAPRRPVLNDRRSTR